MYIVFKTAVSNVRILVLKIRGRERIAFERCHGLGRIFLIYLAKVSIDVTRALLFHVNVIDQIAKPLPVLFVRPRKI